MYKCANINCANDDSASSQELIACSGICSQLYHLQCIGVSCGAPKYWKEYNQFLRYYCDECRTINLSHVLQAIKSNNDFLLSVTDSLSIVSKSIRNNENKMEKKFNTFREQIEDLECHMSNIDAKCTSQGNNLSLLSTNFQKAIANIDSSNEISIKNDEMLAAKLIFQTDSLHSTLKRLKLTLERELDTYKSSIDKLNTANLDNFNALVSQFSNLKNGFNIDEISSRLSVASNEMIETKILLKDLIEEVKYLKIDNFTNPNQIIQNNKSIGISLCEELSNVENTEPSKDLMEIPNTVSSPSKLRLIPLTPELLKTVPNSPLPETTTPDLTPISEPVISPTPIYKFGEY